jgi:hypothetical protein
MSLADFSFFLPLGILFCALAALSGLWMARHPAAESVAREKLDPLHAQFSRWTRMPQWPAYRAQQLDPVCIARAGRRRACLFGGLTLILILIHFTQGS